MYFASRLYNVVQVELRKVSVNKVHLPRLQNRLPTAAEEVYK